MAPAPLLLHVAAQLSWTRFTVHPSTVIGLAGLGVLYAWRYRTGRPGPVRRSAPQDRLREGPPVPSAEASGPASLHSSARQPVLFATGLIVMFLTLNGWVHDLSDYYLFSAHMMQHLALALIVAPLLIMGTPGWMLRPVVESRALGPVLHAITRAVPAFAIFNVTVAAWHLPPLYNLAMAHHEVHIGQHLMFLAASVIMWWPVLSPVREWPRISYPMQMLYLFLMTIPMSVVSVYITYSDAVLYPAYASAPRVMGLSPMNDQLIGGLLMWIPGGLYFFAIISVVFFRWQGEERRVGLAAA